MSTVDTPPWTKEALASWHSAAFWDVEVVRVPLSLPPKDLSFARVRVLFNYLSSLVGYGKFEYTREGVNQAGGICSCRRSRYGVH